MKAFLIFFLMVPYIVFSKDLVNWKIYKKNIDKPVFLLLTDNLNDKSDERVFSNERLAKLLNEKFYPIKIDINKNPDFKNRYLLMTPPSIAILSKEGIIITKKRNYSALTIERDLYNYLETFKDKTAREEQEKLSHRVMYNTFFPAYFFKNTKIFIDRSKEVENFIMDKINLNKMYFDINFMTPLYDYSFSVLNCDVFPYEKLIAVTHLDYLLQSKIFKTDHIFKGAYRDWDKPVKKVVYKDNIKFLNLLYSLGYRDYAMRIDHFLYSHFKDMNDEDKLLYKTFVSDNLSKEEPVEINELIEKNSSSEYIYNQVAVFKAYFSKYKRDKAIIDKFLKFTDSLEKDFYDVEKGIFYDVKKGKEPFGFKYVDIVVNIELAYLYTELYKITRDYNHVITAKTILAFANNTSIDNLIFSKYIIAACNIKEIDKENK